MGRADQVTGVVVLVFSAWVMAEAWRMPQSATFGPGVGFLPFWLGALLAGLSVLLVLKAALAPGPAGEKRVLPPRSALLPVTATLAGLAAYIVLLERLGFLLATGLFTAFLLGVVERERWGPALLVAVVNAVALYVVFRVLLGVALPAGVLGF